METQEEYIINSFDNFIKQINEVGGDVQRERGTLFEKLVLTYLKNEPTYKRLYKNVWELRDVPEEFGIPKQDRGVDLVAEQSNGEIIAIQAKFYKSKIGKNEINSFVAETGAKYYDGGLIISTVDDWNKNARDTIENNHKIIEIIGLSDLRNSQINWSEFSFERPEVVSVKSPKELRFYQKTALELAMKHFETKDRGQLIMAPGTGKTFTSLKIAESLAKKENKQFNVLYLVPSIQLLTQTLRGWNNDTELEITSMAVTSDRDASRGTDGSEDIKATDIGYPATTSKEKLLQNWDDVVKSQQETDMMVVFSTYQSIEVIGKAQKEGFPEFDLIISDEAHRTTGAHEASKDASAFTKVHDNENILGKLRLYQTATPKIYGDNAKKNAKEKSILISSMDDESKYGEVIYRMGFGQAVSHDILTDYKVMVLAVDETAIQKDMQRTLADPENGLNIDDVGRIVGIWNGMMRRNGYKNPIKNSPYDGAPLERAIAFTRTIEDSKKVSQQFEQVVNEYIGSDLEDNSVRLSMRHADGTMNALQKGEVLDWLADPNKPSDEARIVSNVRFLTEGIDVPTLDAVIFLAAKKSQVDIVQAVGRIMRKSEKKDYGYIILPVVIPSGETPETVLDNNKNYEVVWQIINALRSVDERFEAMVDKLNIAKPKQLKVIGVGGAPKKENDLDNKDNKTGKRLEQGQLEFEWDKFEAAIYGKIVQRVGNRKYLENWSEDVAKIAQRQISWIKTKIEENNNPISREFKEFVASLKHNINDSIDENQAAEMLSQHLITKPIFEALFSEYSFVNNNPVSTAMENIVVELEKAGFAKEQESLSPLYESVKMRAEGIEKAEDKQKIIITLYDKFFSTAFKSTTERLGIVFTPIEVVDFIVKSVDYVLKKHYGKTILNKGVHVLDPFTGTGTFIVRILTYLKESMNRSEFTLSDLVHKYTKELHANEIVLLSYYIAAINIEATFDEINGRSCGYVPFEGMVLTDTFESTENKDSFIKDLFNENNARLIKQQNDPIFVVVGNPPYSIGQASVNNDDQNMSYPLLEKRVEVTYSKNSNAKLKKSLNDTYIKAFRWASDRIGDKGIISFISNAGFIDSQSADGLRKHWESEFNYLYIFNLRGDAKRTQGEQRRKEGGNVFGEGSRTPNAITVLVKDGSNKHEIYYNDIGDHLTRERKLQILDKYGSIANVEWTKIDPDDNNDWINQRDMKYQEFSPLFYEKSMKSSIFKKQFTGVYPARDNWVVGFSKEQISRNIDKLINNYNNELIRLSQVSKPNERYSLANKSESFIKWSAKLTTMFKKSESINKEGKIVQILHRPFTKKWIYWDNILNERASSYRGITDIMDKVLYMQGAGSKKEFSCLVTDTLPNLQLIHNGKGFPLYAEKDSFGIVPNISESFLMENNLDIDETLYLVYGVLHSSDYRNKYSNDLIKDFPRIPKLLNRKKFIEIGRKLVELHLNYESVPIFDGLIIESKSNPSYKVTKMKHPKKGMLNTIIFNNDITIKNIPDKAYEYVVNGRPAVQWIMEQYQVLFDKKSGNIDDPNLYSNDEQYIFNLLLRVINVSIQTVDLVNSLPPLDIIE